MWEYKFEELAKFNSDNDKSKYSADYIERMNKLQEEYDSNLLEYAKRNGWIILQNT